MVQKIDALLQTPPTQDGTEGIPPANLEHPDTHHLPRADKATNDFVQEWYPHTVDWERLYGKQPATAAAAAAAAAAAPRKSARQASRPTRAKKPWRALMRRKATACGEDSDSDSTSSSSSSSEAVRHRTVGAVDVQVFRNVLPRAAINLLMKGEQHSVKAIESSSRRWVWGG
jgi:hypothetical protein